MKTKRCTREVYDGWEGTNRCLLDAGHSGPHNYLNPQNMKQQDRFEDNSKE